MCNSEAETMTNTMISTMSNMSLASVLTVGAAIGITYISYRIYRGWASTRLGSSSSLPSEESIPVVNNLDVDQGNSQLYNVIVDAHGLSTVVFVEGVEETEVSSTPNNLINAINELSSTSNELPIMLPAPIDPMLTDYRLLGGPFGLVRQFPFIYHHNTSHIPLYQGYRLQELRGVGEMFNQIDMAYLNVAMVSDINVRCHNILTGMIPHLKLNAGYLTPESYRIMLTTLQEVQANVEITQDLIIIKSARGDKSLLKFFNDLHYYDADITNLMNRIAKVITEIININGSGGFF